MIEVTKVATKTINGSDVTVAASNGVSTTTKKFKLADDCKDIKYKDQGYIYVDYDQLAAFDRWADNGADAIDEIAADAFSYSAGLDNWPVLKEIGGVRYTVNKKANSVVLKDVFLKVLIDVNCDGNFYEAPWYYVEVEIPDGKTVSLEDADMVDEYGSVEYRKDPDGRKIQ